MDVGLDMRRRRVVHHCRDLGDVDPARNDVRTSLTKQILRASHKPSKAIQSYPVQSSELTKYAKHADFTEAATHQAFDLSSAEAFQQLSPLLLRQCGWEFCNALGRQIQPCGRSNIDILRKL